MYIDNFLTYVEKGDDVIVELYSGKMRRGIFVDYDDYAIILYARDSSENFKRIIPLDEVELVILVYSNNIKTKIKSKNKKSD